MKNIKLLPVKFMILILTIFAARHISAQIPPQKKLNSSITFDKYFKDTLTFTKKWDYPWYIVMDDDGGNMENTLAGTLNETDTAHLHHTASCWTNHQGRHHIRYCDAILNNGTIHLLFQPELPAYASELSVLINGNNFCCDFSAAYPAPTGKLSWVVTKQKLVLDKKSYKPGDTIKGYIEVEFIESAAKANEKSIGKSYYYKGYFKTPLLTGE